MTEFHIEIPGMAWIGTWKSQNSNKFSLVQRFRVWCEDIHIKNEASFMVFFNKHQNHYHHRLNSPLHDIIRQGIMKQWLYVVSAMEQRIFIGQHPLIHTQCGQMVCDPVPNAANETHSVQSDRCTTPFHNKTIKDGDISPLTIWPSKVWTR